MWTTIGVLCAIVVLNIALWVASRRTTPTRIVVVQVERRNLMRHWRVKLIVYQEDGPSWPEVMKVDAPTRGAARRMAFEQARLAGLWVRRIVYVEPASRRKSR